MSCATAAIVGCQHAALGKQAAACRTRSSASPTRPSTPSPGSARTSSGVRSATPRCRAAARIAAAMGCSDCDSTDAASGEQLVVAVPVERAHRIERQVAGRHRAGLVERDHANAGQPLEMNAALDEHALPRRAGERRHDRHGRRDHQRARTRHHQQHQRAIQPHVERLAERPATGTVATSAARIDDRRRVPRRKAIDELLHRRALGLRRFDEVNDARQRGVARGGASRRRSARHGR